MNVPPYPRENGCRGILLGIVLDLVVLSVIAGFGWLLFWATAGAMDGNDKKNAAQDRVGASMVPTAPEQAKALLDYQGERR